ncbi:GTPase [Globicatella sp. PHS-GS-PNBC-21-1553]|uniref:GTPase n=1 Tax=Globicatella sp. PHS-GS-PNBC-21-1553 TaxID=2885764 RepID=UPI00298F08AB|nr:GTPase [Globicatella sp. PHS-GS-PNBC-21-1553]WPC07739.1 50S ribosome-binding GTPase [Globicatella sp. PHS-GS-PNBC-21-1553]
MNNQNTISLAIWTAKSKELLDKVINVLDKIGIEKSHLPKNVYESDKPISLVFAGQYSAGKSTILKALTGISSIATGEKITTQESQVYEWNGINVIDTPGIHTTLRPDHDDISYRAISNADMLVYVITHELFDSYIGQNFRKLLLDKDKAGEMILIVNKMADVGNTIENQLIKLENLKIVTDPYTPEQLRTCFVDVESYLDSLTEEDAEIADELRIRSNYEGLVSTINDFVKERSISSRLTTALYKIYDVLQKAITQFEPSSGDDDVDALEEHLLQERRILFSTQWRIEQQVKIIYEEAATSIRDKGRNIANSIYDYSNENDANNAIETAYHEVEKISSTCLDNVISELEKLSSDCKSELDEFYKTDFSKNLQFRLSEKYKKGNPLVNRIFNSDVLAQGSNKIISNTIGTNAPANGLRAFSGSNIHQMVLDIGHFFGHSFKPWEAVKWVKGINVAGKVLGVFGVVFSLGMQAKEDVDADKRQQEMRSNREKLRAGFNDAANELVKHFNKAISEYLANNFHLRISEIDNQISEIRKLRIGKSENYKLLEAAQSECRALIADIHKEM